MNHDLSTFDYVYLSDFLSCFFFKCSVILFYLCRHHMAGVFLGLKSLRATASCVQIIFMVLLALGLAGAVPSKKFDWMSNPCSKTAHRRPHRSAAETELKFFSNTLINETFKKLELLYPNSTELNDISSSSKRLSRCPSIGKMIKQVRRARTRVAKQKQFYVALGHIDQYLEQLENISIRTEAPFDIELRKQIYSQTKKRLILTRCEFSYTYRLHNINWKHRQPDLHCVPHEADLTKLQSWDIQFFLKLKKFLNFGKRKVSKWSGKKHRKVRTTTRSYSS